MSRLHTLVLWDIDGTLVDVHGAGRRAFARGIERAWGIVDDLADVKFAGATDLGVLDALRARLHLPPEHVAAFFAHMAEALEELCVEGHARAVEGAVEVVRALAVDGVTQGLLTGIARATAFVKLRAAGIPTEPFAEGAFGDEHADRRELARRVRARAVVAAQADMRVAVVGDTAKDVEAAHAIGALAIALRRRADDDLSAADCVVTDLRAVLPLVRSL